MTPISVGIIGFGRIGAEHARWLSQCQGARPTAVADATPARQQIAQQLGLKSYSTIADLLWDDSINAILVSTPTSMHFEHVQLALNAGKHVLVEKPMALDLDQARR
ncbi:MAG TPA: Gfo/Idh/MocA family oxidoreductase, partial [Tepidisphaeraceae bacterium]|nr:Gfo/Idh/MocA family oxidoreductase [Tepidisphaeraceae bacterium]